MKNILKSFTLLILISIASCEVVEPPEVRCFPETMTNIIFFGETTTRETANFSYKSETELVDHITWSTKEEHYFEYDNDERLVKVRLKKIVFGIQEELWFSYDGIKVTRIDKAIKRLDLTQEPIEGDSTFIGYHIFSYDGLNIQSEMIYESDNGKNNTLVREKDYEYDENGNLTRISDMNVLTKSSVTYSYTYHESKHPYSQILLYFQGESAINNVLTMTDETEELDYTYDITLNLNQYPTEILERINGTLSRIIRYTYTCK